MHRQHTGTQEGTAGTCCQQGPLLACRGFSDISNPMLRRKTLPGNLLQKKPQIPPCALPSTRHQLWRRTCALFIGNLCPCTAPSGDQAQADAIAPGARFGAADPRVYACWRSGLVLPAALQLAGEREPGRAVEQHAWR